METSRESHFDVAVVGAGPAGLAAAIRARWVKSYRGVPCSTVICDPARPGGLARFRSAMLTGPSFHLPGKDLVHSLEADRSSLNIPLLSTTVDSLALRDQRWHIASGGRPVCVARAVILAPGMRRLANEAEFFNRGLTLTYNGYDYLLECLSRLLRDVKEPRLLVVGNAKTINLLPVLRAIRQPDLELEYLLDEEPSVGLAQAFGAVVRFGQVERYVGGTHLEAVEVMDRAGARSTIHCKLVFLDYNAFELKPAFGIAVAGLECDASGFVKIDRRGSTNLPGLFAAGDATGVYAMVLKALYEGAAAGFSAYCHVFQQKFGCPPPLFAYAATDQPVQPELLDYPELLDDDTVEVLVPDLFERIASEFGLPESPSGVFTVGELRAMCGKSEANRLAYQLLDNKAITIQPREAKRRSFAERS